jgi:hypothetical protein
MLAIQQFRAIDAWKSGDWSNLDLPLAISAKVIATPSAAASVRRLQFLS